MTPVEILGWLAALAGFVTGFPQAVKLIRTRNTAGLSLLAWQTILVLNLMWAAHGLRIGAVNMVVPNLLALASTVPIVVLIAKARQVAWWRAIVPALLATAVFVAIDGGWGSTAFGVASLIPAVLANIGQSVELVRSISVAGVSVPYLVLGFINQVLWLGWAWLLPETSTIISSTLIATLIGFNLVWCLLRRGGLRAFWPEPVLQPMDPHLSAP